MNKSKGNPQNIPILAMLCLLALQACGAMRPGFESPTITVSSFRPVSAQGALPEFEIGLHVINPNAEALTLRGIAYTVSLNGRELIQGVSNELPVIEGYGTGDFSLHATADLIGGIRFFSDLMNGENDGVHYELEAKLDVGKFLPAIRIKDSGDFLPPTSAGSRK
jgi:LEA14-like dessication related protein